MTTNSASDFDDLSEHFRRMVELSFDTSPLYRALCPGARAGARPGATATVPDLDAVPLLADKTGVDVHPQAHTQPLTVIAGDAATPLVRVDGHLHWLEPLR